MGRGLDDLFVLFPVLFQNLNCELQIGRLSVYTCLLFIENQNAPRPSEHPPVVVVVVVVSYIQRIGCQPENEPI